MPSEADWEEEDYAFVRGLFEGWTPDPLPSPAWRGIVQEGRGLKPDPEPTGKAEQPTLYAAWAISYTRLIGDYGGDTAPVRYGEVVVSRFIEPGVGKGPLRLLRRAILAQLDGADEDGPLTLNPRAARSVKVGYVAGWYVENVVIPFCGG